MSYHIEINLTSKDLISESPEDPFIEPISSIGNSEVLPERFGRGSVSMTSIYSTSDSIVDSIPFTQSTTLTEPEWKADGVIRLFKDTGSACSSLHETLSNNPCVNLSTSLKPCLGLVIAVLAVPHYLTPADFLLFIGKFSELTSEIKLLK